MAEAFLNGRAVSFDQAVGEAARLLSGARLPLVSGLSADAAATTAALQLARRLNAVVDHAQGRTLAKLSAVLASTGTLSATPSEVRARSDVLLLAGPAGDGALLDYAAAGAAGAVIALGAEPRRIKRDGRTVLTVPAADDAALVGVLSSLRAALAGRLPRLPRALTQAVETLRGATYGAALYDPAALSEPAMTMLMALVNDLNAHTRFTSMALGVPGNGMGALLAAGWVAGSPLPFAHRSDGETVHDPFCCDGARLLAAGECDAVLWLDTLGGTAPATGKTPCVAIALAPKPGATVSFVAGRPGVDHDGVLYRGEIATLANHPATHPRPVTTAASVIEAISAALPARRAREARR